MAADGEVKRVQVWAGPTGLLLVALLFLVLPMATASCSLPADLPEGSGAVSVSVSGADVVTGGDPDFSVSGVFELSPEANAGMASEAAPKGAVRVWGIATAVVMGLGLLTMFVRVWRLRAILTAAVASVAAALLVATEVALVGRLVSLAEQEATWLVHLPSARGVDVVGRAGEVVGAAVGFWVALAGLVLVAGVNVVLLVRPGPPPLPDGGGRFGLGGAG